MGKDILTKLCSFLDDDNTAYYGLRTLSCLGVEVSGGIRFRILTGGVIEAMTAREIPFFVRKTYVTV